MSGAACTTRSRLIPKLPGCGRALLSRRGQMHDLFMPVVDGDIWTECRMLMEACRFYDIEAVADWACAKPHSWARPASLAA